MAIIVRRLTGADAVQYRAVRLHGLLHDPVAFNGCYAEESLLTDRDYADWLIEPPSNSAIFGAWQSEELVGVVGLQVESALKMRHKARLWGMYTLPETRGMGVGSALMMHLLSYARSVATIERILLAVTASNVAVSAWYEKMGFQLYGLETNAVKFGLNYDHDELRVLNLYGTVDADQNN